MASAERPRRLALVVTTYNRPEALARVLAGCAAQTDTAFDVVIADDGSRDDTRAAVEAAAKTAPYPLRHVWHPDDGFRAAEIRNRGVLATDADYLVFLDGDCVPRTDFVARHRALAQPGRFLSGSRILLDEEMTREVVAHQIDIHLKDRAYWFRAWRAGRINKFLPLLVPGLPRRARSATPACVASRAATWAYGAAISSASTASTRASSAGVTKMRTWQCGCTTPVCGASAASVRRKCSTSGIASSRASRKARTTAA